MAYEAYKKFTQFHTFSHFIALSQLPYPTQRGLYAGQPPLTDQYFTLFCIYWSTIELYNSLEFPRAAAGPETSCHSTHDYTYTYTLYTYATLTLYQAAGPIAKLLSTVKYSMDTKLQSLIVSIALVIIWYVIYVWLLTRSIGSLSRLCACTLWYSPYHTHTLWRSRRSLYNAHRLWLKNSHSTQSTLRPSLCKLPTYSVINCPISLTMIQNQYGI